MTQKKPGKLLHAGPVRAAKPMKVYDTAVPVVAFRADSNASMLSGTSLVAIFCVATAPPLLSGLSLSFVFVLLAFKFVVGQFDIAVRVFRYFGGGRRCALEVGGALCCPIIIPP